MAEQVFQNQRQNQRVASTLPIQLKFGTQITIQGQLKDISANSAFVKIKSSVYMAPQDELDFSILRSSNNEEFVQGTARIFRIAPGEGIAIYFTKMDDDSTQKLRELIG